jgi:hypothetical protein
MGLNSRVGKKLKIKNQLQRKLVREGLTKSERNLYNKILSEAPIDYEGPERMEPGIERKITQKQTPYAEHPALPKGDRDFVELVSSKRFKDSVDKVRRYLGDTQSIQGPNPIMNLMGSIMNGLRQIMSIESQHKEYLENLAVDLVVKELGIPDGSLQFDAKLVHGGMSAAQGMKTKPDEFDEDEIKDAFKEANEEAAENKEDLEDFVDAFEKFNLEKAKRRMINSLIQGAAFKGGHMYILLNRELSDINPNLMNLYGVTQSLMEHLYWLYPDMEGMAGSGQGQMGQSEVDEQTDPPTVIARAGTFPLLVHELVKGIYEIFGTHGLPDDPRQAEMVLGSEDTLPAEIWDSRLGPVFWEKLQDAYPDRLYDDDKKYLQHYLFARFSRLNANEFITLAKQILSDDPKAKQVLDRMVSEIIDEIKKEEYKSAIGDYDEDDSDFYDDLDQDDMDDLNTFLGGFGISGSDVGDDDDDTLV